MTAVKLGRIWVCRIRSAFPKLSLVQRAAIQFSSACQGHCGVIRRTAASIRLAMVARRGSRCLKARIFRPAARQSPSIQAIQISFSPVFGIFVARAGNIVPVAAALISLPGADCCVRRTAVALGRRLRPKATRGSRRSLMVVSPWRLRPPMPNAFMSLSNHLTALFSFPMTAA